VYNLVYMQHFEYIITHVYMKIIIRRIWTGYVWVCFYIVLIYNIILLLHVLLTGVWVSVNGSSNRGTKESK